MRPFRKIVFLSFVLAAIVGFWLIPNINKAKENRYVRIYEDTDDKEKDSKEKKSSKKERKETRKVKKEQKAETKKYRQEEISELKISKIKPSMYSRAIHFKEMKELIAEGVITLDSVTVSADTSAVVAQKQE